MKGITTATWTRRIRILIAALAAAALTSCLGVEIETKFNADGSGTMSMKMTVSKAFAEMGTDAEETGLDIPMSKEDIEAQFEGVKGVKLLEVTQTETEEDLIFNTRLSFDSFDSLLAAEDSPVETATLRKEGGKTIFSIPVGDAEKAMQSEDSPMAGADMDEAMLAMVQAFLEGYLMQYTVTAPSKITSYSKGELSPDGKTVTLRLPMADYFVLAEPYAFEVAW